MKLKFNGEGGESIVNESLMNKEFHLTELTIKEKKVRIYDNCLPLDDFKKMKEILLTDINLCHDFCYN